MYEFKDPGGRGRAAIIAVLAWLAADLVYTIGAATTIAALNGAASGTGPAPETADMITGAGGVALMVATLGSIIFVARWIMRVNANAHSLSDSMTVTPGWNVGWFFIPVALLWKPFQGLRETWQASVSPHDPTSVAVPPLMRWWWGLWLVSNALGNVSTRLSFGKADAASLIASSWIDIATLAIDIPLAIVLIRMILQFDDLQARGPDYAETFA